MINLFHFNKKDKQQRPPPVVEPSIADRFLEAASWIIMTALWIFMIAEMKKLPEIIPSHFTVNGEIDDYSDKATLWLLPSIGTVLFLGLTWLNRFPQIFNYPVKITAENAVKQYKMATRLIRILKLTLLIVFFMISFMIIKSAKGELIQPVKLLVPAILFMTLVPVGIYLFKSVSSK